MLPLDQAISAVWTSTVELARRTLVDRPKVGRRKDATRSRVGNGTALLVGVDGRSVWVRRLKEVIASHLSDLGGDDNTSAAERSIIRRASTLTVECEALEAKFATAGHANVADLDLYQKLSNTLRRLLEAVGLQRRSRNITPTLDQYLQQQREAVE